MAPSSSATADPILPSLRSIRACFDSYRNGNQARQLRFFLEECIRNFSDDPRYRDDIRLLKVYIIYADVIRDFRTVYEKLTEKKICQKQALFYEAFAIFHVIEGELAKADKILLAGVAGSVDPFRVANTREVFRKNLIEIVRNIRVHVPEVDSGSKNRIDPFSRKTVNHLLEAMHAELKKLEGNCWRSNEYPGKGTVRNKTFRGFSENMIIQLGRNQYEIGGKLAEGAYAEVYTAYIDSNPNNVVALKVHKKNSDNDLLLWEFYMYRLLDKRITDNKRSSFGFARSLDMYSDCGILVCDYVSPITLLDAVNSYRTKGESMEEVVCVYYTLEMLGMLETLHDAGIMHGDFKADNLLVRYASAKLTVDGFSCRTGPWHDQGLCLVDWGKGIDLDQFPDGTEFIGNCLTQDYICSEMIEKRSWTYQADIYALCVNVYTMLYGEYMAVEKDGTHYQPIPPQRERRVPLVIENMWKDLFSWLLNVQSNDRVSNLMLLRDLKKSFEDYMYSDPQRIQNLTDFLAKEKFSMVL